MKVNKHLDREVATNSWKLLILSSIVFVITLWSAMKFSQAVDNEKSYIKEPTIIEAKVVEIKPDPVCEVWVLSIDFGGASPFVWSNRKAVKTKNGLLEISTDSKRDHQ